MVLLLNLEIDMQFSAFQNCITQSQDGAYSEIAWNITHSIYVYCCIINKKLI